MPRIAKKDYDAQIRWEEKISRAKKVKAEWKKLFNVDKALDYLDGKQNPGEPSNEWITINKVYSHLKSQLPALYSADPYFYMKLKKSFSLNPMDRAMYDKQAKTRQAMLNYLKEEIGLKPKARLSIQDAFFSYGIAKVRHRSDSSENPYYGEYITGEEGDVLLDDTGTPLNEPETIPINERYELHRIHPDDFLFDEDAGPLEDDWNWVAQRIRIPMKEAKENKLFSKQALKKLEGKGETKDDDEKKREERKKGDVKGITERDNYSNKKYGGKEPDIVVYWEIYEIKKKKWSAISENGEIPLFHNEDYPPGIEDHPFSHLRFTLRDDSPYPIPPMSQMIPLCLEYNLSRSRLLKHRKRFNRKYLATGPWEDDDAQLSKLESGEDGTVIVGQPGTEVKAIQDAQLDQMGIQEIMMLNHDINEVGGNVTDEAKGIAGADSATQAGILNQRLEMREGDAMSMVVDFIKDIAKKLDQLIQAHITRDEAVRITGPQGEFWALVKASDYQEINGEFEYSVNVGATLPQLPQMERQSWQAFLGLLNNFPHLMLSKRLIKQMAEMHHIEDEAMIEELMQIGKQIMSGQMPMPGQSGSQAGVGETRPTSAMGGMLGGAQNAV